MSVEIIIPQFFVHAVDDVKQAFVQGKTVGECLDDLVKQFPQLRPMLFERKGKLHGYLGIFVNEAGAYPEELMKPVNDGDRINIVNIIAGG